MKPHSCRGQLSLSMNRTRCPPGLQCSCSLHRRAAGASLRRTVKPTLAKAILTDLHFWLPVAVLTFGIALLALVR